MKCPRCGGKGRIVMTSTDKVTIEGFPMIIPCPECNQQGQTYCCGGSPSDAVLDRLHKFTPAEGE